MPSLLLPLLLVLPLAAALVLPLLAGANATKVRNLAASACAAQFLVTMLCWRQPPPELHIAR